MLSDTLPAPISVVRSASISVVGGVREPRDFRRRFIRPLRGVWVEGSGRPLTREEWADVRQDLAPVRPTLPARPFCPPAIFPSAHARRA